jgi:hypothetical protein
LTSSAAIERRQQPAAQQQAVEADGRNASRPATSLLSPVVKYHGLGPCHPHRRGFWVRPLLNGGTLAGRETMSSSSLREPEPNHPILDRAWTYEIVGLRLERVPLDGGEPFLDLVLRSGAERRLLRFWSPADLEIEKGGPTMTSGLAILDVRARGLEHIGVMVTDFEASTGSVRFVARTVEDITD